MQRIVGGGVNLRPCFSVIVHAGKKKREECWKKCLSQNNTGITNLLAYYYGGGLLVLLARNSNHIASKRAESGHRMNGLTLQGLSWRGWFFSSTSTSWPLLLGFQMLWTWLLINRISGNESDETLLTAHSKKSSSLELQVVVSYFYCMMLIVTNQLSPCYGHPLD